MNLFGVLLRKQRCTSTQVWPSWYHSSLSIQGCKAGTLTFRLRLFWVAGCPQEVIKWSILISKLCFSGKYYLLRKHKALLTCHIKALLYFIKRNLILNSSGTSNLSFRLRYLIFFPFVCGKPDVWPYQNMFCFTSDSTLPGALTFL